MSFELDQTATQPWGWDPETEMTVGIFVVRLLAYLIIRMSACETDYTAIQTKSLAWRWFSVGSLQNRLGKKWGRPPKQQASPHIRGWSIHLLTAPGEHRVDLSSGEEGDSPRKGLKEADPSRGGLYFCHRTTSCFCSKRIWYQGRRLLRICAEPQRCFSR